MSEKEPTIPTKEQIEAWQKQQAAQELQNRHQLLRDLVAMADERGYQILATPQIDNGLLVAIWGVQEKPK